MEKITVQNVQGYMEQVDLINVFTIKELNKDFIIFSKGESAGEGLLKIYVSEIVEEQTNVFKMVGISNDDIWNKVKLTLKEIVNNGIKD